MATNGYTDNDESNDYHFITHWRISGEPNEVFAVLGDAEGLPRWWPSVYLEVDQIEPEDVNGVGSRVKLYTKGWLPYSLRWQFVVTEVTSSSLTLVASGDFVGRGIWSFKEDGDWVNITYDWKIEANKPLLKYFSLIAKPLFSLNHEWAMRKGEASLVLELRRRKDPNDPNIPAPPPATPSKLLPWLVYVITHPNSLHSG